MKLSELEEKTLKEAVDNGMIMTITKSDGEELIAIKQKLIALGLLNPTKSALKPTAKAFEYFNPDLKDEIPSVVTNNFRGDNYGTIVNQSSDFRVESPINPSTNNKTPIKKSKIDWASILKIIAAIIAVIFAILKGFGIL